jgi:hypothetical protein
MIAASGWPDIGCAPRALGFLLSGDGRTDLPAPNCPKNLGVEVWRPALRQDPSERALNVISRGRLVGMIRTPSQRWSFRRMHRKGE